ncbi:DUF2889 domain-containing protein [Minwuia sp.]|uniref:DUF2889 domain-containing protein n=1 Tax=Minwuia sp. TaxID=2493630 RepID=UPI003A929EE9
MALSPPVKRVHRHTRAIDIRGYEREDGLWDMEGTISDHKPTAYGVMEERREDGMVHTMHLRLTVDTDFLIHAAELHSEVTPHRMCTEVEPNFGALAGLRIGPGFNRKARERIGGTAGCTHVVELLPQMATATMQTIWPIRNYMAPSDKDGGKPGVLNTCHTWSESSPVVARQYPEFYRPADAEAEHG